MNAEMEDAEFKNSQLFILQLWQLIGRDYPHAKRIHLTLDNYRIHSSLQAQAALARLNGRIVLHFLPPYCPDHNRIERVWRDLHANVTRNHQCRTMKKLMNEVNHWLKTATGVWFYRNRDTWVCLRPTRANAPQS